MPDASIASGSGAPRISYDWGTSSDLKALYTQTYTIFNSLQRIQQEAILSHHTAATITGAAARSAPHNALLPSVETIQYYQRISEHYARAIQEYIHRTQLQDEPDVSAIHKWQQAQTILRLAELLYYPKDGRGISVVGEELLHWLNSFDVAPTTEEGQEIAQSTTPHNHPAYWDYILRCVLRGFHTSAASVLKSLDAHTSPVIRTVAQKTAQLLSSIPRSTSFAMEHEFAAAHRSWLGSVRRVISGLEREMDEMEAHAGHTEEIEDERLEYEAQFRCLLELMAGVKDRIFEACEDWREALGAWGTLVHPTLKRDDIPATVAVILDKFPIDTSIPSETVQSLLVQGDVRRAVEKARDVDIWLAAHLGDLTDKVGLLDQNDADHATTDTSTSNATLRQTLLLEYAQSMLEEQGLWRISIDYLAACGACGRKQMTQVILGVPVQGPGALDGELTDDDDDDDVDGDADMDMENDDEGMDRNAAANGRSPRKAKAPKLDRAEQVLRACTEHGLEAEARVVCKRMSASLVEQGQYGLAIAYCVRAADTVLIRKIADRILEEYVSGGADAFTRIVDSIPTSLIAPPTGLDTDNDNDGFFSDPTSPTPGLGLGGTVAARGFFSKRLSFLARLRDFHRLYAERNLTAAATLLVELITTEAAPERFLAVLLVDAIPLLEDPDAAWFDRAQTFELIRTVESITSSVAMHPHLSAHFLGLLDTLLGVQQTPAEPATQSNAGATGITRASDKLDAVRLSLARNLARVGILQHGIQ
ncbi:hypothetical protein BCV70DRAFT_202209 [Testicularia cyperi]|uniref:Nuclear pore complex protein Nup85 n=1 Tax=Testicularia cyperi TaxID=1882483 RepID=A0A317XJQ9_9BASI|nr:hypothetical protein BCV70DRAFT_202209 [Testicularia cyperi]